MARTALLSQFAVLLFSVSTPVFGTTPPICDVECAPDPSGGTGYVAARTAPLNARGALNKIRPIHKTGPKITHNVGSQSYNYAIPIVHLSGRNHLDLDLTLYYNSAVWSMDSPHSGANFNADRDWPSYGFRLDFGYIESGLDANGNPMYVLTRADGSKNQLTYTLDANNHITNIYKSLDSSFVTYNTTTRIAAFRDGTQIFYQAFPTQGGSPIDFRPTKIEDSNGNYISISYVSGKDQSINQVTDTLGRVVQFNYDGAGKLLSLTNPAQANPQPDQGPGTYATFQWGTKYGSGYVWYQFKAPFAAVTAPAYSIALNVLSGCTYPNNSGYTFAYGDWGIINKISQLGSNSAVKTYVRYDYPPATAALANAPVYQNQFVSRDGTSATEETWNFNVTTTNGAVSGYAVTDPAGAVTTSTLDTSTGPTGGSVRSATIAQGSTILRSVTNTWTFDSGLYPNPRLSQVQTTLNDTGQSSKVVYASYDVNGNVTDEQEYDFDGSLKRETVSSYWPSPSGNILDHPLDIQVKAGTTVVAHTHFGYDETGVGAAPSGALGYDTNYSASRGNLTTITRYVNPSTSISRTLSYNVFGDTITAQADCCTQKTSVFSSATQWAYPDSETRGGAGGTQLTTAATYYFQTGKIATTIDENLQTTTYHYADPWGRATQILQPDGTHLDTSYDDTYSTDSTYPTPSVTTSNSANSGMDITRFDGLGRVVRKHVANGSPSTLVSIVQTSYDDINRAVSTSNPYAPGTTPVYTQTKSDALGRTASVTPPNSTTHPYSYSYSGNAVTATDPAGMQRRSYSDALGRLVQVDEPGPKPPTYATGSVTIGGTLKTITAAPGRGTVTIGGGDNSIPGQDCPAPPGPCPPIYDFGTVKVTVNGTTYSTNYVKTSTQNGIASALATAISGSSVVSATASSNVITITARTNGSNTNYTLSAQTVSSDPTDFPAGSFKPTPSGSTLTGGATAASDTGTTTITVNSCASSISYGSGNNTSSQVAAALVSKVNSTCSAYVTAAAAGSIVNITSKTTSASADYPLSATSVSNQSGTFGTNGSFTATPSGSALAGGDVGGEISLNNPLSTFYTYDVLDNLTNVAQGVQTRTYVYDGLGRVISVTTPESGTTTYGYIPAFTCVTNDPAEPCQRTDARSVATNYTYDTLNRLKQISYTLPNGSVVDPTSTVNFNYDTGSFALGRLSSVSNANASDSYVYDLLGRITQDSKVIGGVTYNIGYGYNAAGQLNSITYPSGRTVTQGYDTVARLNQVSSPGLGTPYLSVPSDGYDAASQAVKFNYGNGVLGIFGYNDHMQLQSIEYKNAAGIDLFNLTQYSYTAPNGGNNGQIQAIADNRGAAYSTTYTYDPWGRLSAAQTNDLNSANTWALNWTYDRYGNRLTQSQTGGAGAATEPNLSIDPSTNHVTNSGFQYDAAGNTAADGNNNYTFDAENRMTYVNNLGPLGFTANYAYDAAGLRVLKSVLASGSNTVYVFSGSKVIAEYNSGAAATSPVTEYVYAGDQLLARLDSSGSPTYRYADHLSGRVETDASANVVRTFGSLPFGETWYECGPTCTTGPSITDKWKFTTYEQDAESGLDFALSRYFQSGSGRFNSQDPLGGDISSPESLNRYAYVTNDPIDQEDPIGQDPIYPDPTHPGWAAAFESEWDIFNAWVGGGDGPFWQSVYGGGFIKYISRANYDYTCPEQVSCSPSWDVGGAILFAFFFGNGGGGTTLNNPCAGVSPSSLDYSKNKQHIIDEHLAWFQHKSAPDMTSSQYSFQGISTVDQAWSQITQFNSYSFQNPESIKAVGDAYQFTASYPVHGDAAYTGIERRKHNTIYGIPIYTSTRTTKNTIVVKKDCKTVVTSYPGEP